MTDPLVPDADELDPDPDITDVVVAPRPTNKVQDHEADDDV